MSRCAALALVASLTLLGATALPDAPPSPAPGANCKDAAEPLESYEVANEADATFDAVVAATRVSNAYDRCAAFAAARGNVEDLHDMQVRSAYYHYAAGRSFFAAEEYPQAHAQLEAALKLVADAIVWTQPGAANQPPGRQSRYRAAALTVRDAANALLAKIPVPTGISTAPATTPATAAPH